MITLTEKAVTAVKEIAADQGLDHLFIRLRVLGGGCAGMTHDMYFDDVHIKADTDELFEQDGISILIDQVSYMYMENITIDYIEGVISSGFQFKSPDIKSTCGCGSSVQY